MSSDTNTTGAELTELDSKLLTLNERKMNVYSQNIGATGFRKYYLSNEGDGKELLASKVSSGIADLEESKDSLILVTERSRGGSVCIGSIIPLSADVCLYRRGDNLNVRAIKDALEDIISLRSRFTSKKKLMTLGTRSVVDAKNDEIEVYENADLCEIDIKKIVALKEYMSSKYPSHISEWRRGMLSAIRTDVHEIDR